MKQIIDSLPKVSQPRLKNVAICHCRYLTQTNIHLPAISSIPHRLCRGCTPTRGILKIWAGGRTTQSLRRVKRANDNLGSRGASEIESLRVVENKNPSDDTKGKMENIEVIANSKILRKSLAQQKFLSRSSDGHAAQSSYETANPGRIQTQAVGPNFSKNSAISIHKLPKGDIYHLVDDNK